MKSYRIVYSFSWEGECSPIGSCIRSVGRENEVLSGIVYSFSWEIMKSYRIVYSFSWKGE